MRWSAKNKYSYYLDICHRGSCGRNPCLHFWRKPRSLFCDNTSCICTARFCFCNRLDNTVFSYRRCGRSGFWIWGQMSWGRKGLFLFVLMLFFNYIWYPLFFGGGMFFIALLDILVMIILSLAIRKLFGKIYFTAKLIMTVYIIWLVYAALLNFSVVLLNWQQTIRYTGKNFIMLLNFVKISGIIYYTEDFFGCRNFTEIAWHR